MAQETQAGHKNSVYRKIIIKETMVSYQQCSGSFTAEWKMDPRKTGTTVCKAEICISI